MLVAVIIFYSLYSGISVFSAAAKTLDVTISSNKSTIFPGEIFTETIGLCNFVGIDAGGIRAFYLKLSYDSSKFDVSTEKVAPAAGSGISADELQCNVSTDKLVIIYSDKGNGTDGTALNAGSAITITFTAKSNVSVGVYDFALTPGSTISFIDTSYSAANATSDQVVARSVEAIMPTNLAITISTKPVAFGSYILESSVGSGIVIINIQPETKVSTFTALISQEINGTLTLKNAENTDITNNPNALIGTGTTLTTALNNISNTYTIEIYGDLSGDGKINLNDLISIRNYILGTNPLNGIYEFAGDLFGEGDITLNDLVGISAFVSQSGNISQNPQNLVTEVKTPAIINTKYATDDVVIADYVVTNAKYDADYTGTKDSTSAIQSALNDCYSAGGGTVWLPAGTYKVTNTIYVPSFVTLRGDWRDPDSGSGDFGTVISAQVACGDSGPVLFQIGGSAGVMGITTYYPNQSATTPVAYNYTFNIPSGAWVGQTGTYMSSSVINCTMLNSYRGIGIDALDNTKVHELSTVKNVKGTVLFRGAVAYNGADVGTWENITFNNSYWANAGTKYNAPNVAILNAWTRANGTGFTLGDLEWDQFISLSCSNYNYGINIVAGSRISFCGEFLYTNIQNTNIAVKVDNIDTRWGMSFLRSTLIGSTKAIQNNTTGNVNVCDSALTGGTTGKITTTSPGTTPTSYVAAIPSKVTRTVLYDVTKAPYYASHSAVQTGIPSADATVAIQAALTDAGNAGGGVVYLPAGWYRINTHLTVPANVELRGSSSVPQRDQGDLSYGTVLFGYEGKGTATPDTDTALITLNGNTSGISGIRFFYLENNPA